MTYLNDLISSRELLVNLTAREVKGKYRRTVFGQLWSLINPLATMVIYTIVYSFIFKARIEVGNPSGLNVYPLWLMCGLLPWMFFRHVLNAGMTSIVSNGSLIKKVYFPRMNLPLAAVGSFGFTFLIEMGVLLIALAAFGSFIWPWLPLVAVSIVLLAMFATGLGLMLAIVNVHFRDMQHLVSIALQMWMYLTPIIYPLTLVEEAAQKVNKPWILDLYKVNPMERFTTVFRNFLYDNTWPDWTDMLYIVVAAFASLALGYFIFSRNEKRLAEML
ncbi:MULTISPECIES: ABC transporter permease [unclassified Frondihabitans]|uniref:ABC transporter permease n=1 Tax=unclassified Frondihabitans TaxID=2626248 RepID=UPI000700E08F|nr:MULTISPECIES: ABC transporter permease [unclassified Frondihabitans]KQQ28068.1 ABC transporter [Frondihabitans sp. Leaf304]MBF4575895.1 ABC transporter permease [Frondihabitans sp. VKM Ac-2883]